MQPRAVYRSLLVRGFDPPEAANLAAFTVGLRCPGIRWSLHQVEALAALRARASSSTDPDDRPTQQLVWSRS